MPPTIAELVVAAEPDAWVAAGFAVEDGAVQAGTVRVRLAGSQAGRGIVSWTLRGVEADDLDGLPTTPAGGPPEGEKSEHPNGVERIDHVVVVTPDLKRTTAALAAAGIERRRVREVPAGERALHQGFFRLGEVILEVVDGMPLDPSAEPRPGAPAVFWGLVFVVGDLDAAATRLVDHVGAPRPAVQPGRRIATVRREANLGLPVALMSR